MGTLNSRPSFNSTVSLSSVIETDVANGSKLLSAEELMPCPEKLNLVVVNDTPNGAYFRCLKPLAIGDPDGF